MSHGPVSSGATARRDPRLDRSHEAILDAATALLSEGGIGAVTTDGITARSGVARSTLYRHFSTSTEVLAAAFQRLLPPLATPIVGGSPRDRLLRLVREQAQQIEHAPTIAAVIWLAASGVATQAPTEPVERSQLRTLREQVIERYRQPFSAVLGECLRGSEKPDVEEIDRAAAQLVGPLLFNALITKRPNDNAFCTLLVDDFLANHG